MKRQTYDLSAAGWLRVFDRIEESRDGDPPRMQDLLRAVEAENAACPSRLAAAWLQGCRLRIQEPSEFPNTMPPAPWRLPLFVTSIACDAIYEACDLRSAVRSRYDAERALRNLVGLAEGE